MARVIPDFKNDSGEWVRSIVISGLQHYTRSGQRYRAMLDRCCKGGSQQDAYPRYKECENGFECFSQFVEWSVDQVGYEEMFHLDKDLIVRHNKIYSPETCLLLPPTINGFLIKSNAVRGEYPIGVSFHKKLGKLRAYVNDNGNMVHLGTFDNATDAFQAHKVAKERIAKRVAEEWKGKIDPRAYDALMRYEVLITD